MEGEWTWWTGCGAVFIFILIGFSFLVVCLFLEDFKVFGFAHIEIFFASPCSK